MEILMIALTFLLLKNVLSNNLWDIQNDISVNLREKVKKTKIVAYSKVKMTNDEIKNEKIRIENVCQCKVEHLEGVGAFILTYDNPSERAAVSLNLDPSKMVSADDQIVSISNEGIPTDSEFRFQWALQDLANNADINAAEGWREYMSDANGGDPNGPSIVVAVVDTGVDYNHPDLKDVMWTNPGEIPGNGKDDDGNGMIDDVHGADLLNNDGDPNDDVLHGTHCAGIIAAKENNGNGVVGVASFTQGKVKIMALKAFDKDSGSNSAVCQSLNYAILNGARMSSNSWAGPGSVYVPGDRKECYQDLCSGNDSVKIFGQIIRNNPDHLFVAAAGNDPVSIISEGRVLCGLKEPNLLCVANSNEQDTLYRSSTYGKDFVHVVAPGSDIYSTIPPESHPRWPNDTSYAYKSAYMCATGTSMACPHVSGLAALMRTMRPELTPQQIREIIEDNVQKKEAYENVVSSGGLIDMGKTLRALKVHKETSEVNLDEGYWGEWGPVAKCSFPHFVHKMELKIQPKLGKKWTRRWATIARKDNTALNGIRLTCTDGHTITSTQQMWGIWRGVKSCSPGNFINKAQIRREGRRGGGDDRGGNGIRFECTDGNQHEPGDGYWGLWSPWGSCQNGSAIMGLQTRVENYQGQGDDTALNDVRFFCAQLLRGDRK